MSGLDQTLVDAALALAEERFSEGEYCVAALRTTTGKVLTSVYVEARVEGACLCAETGAICEAHKLGEPVVASVCIGKRATSPKPYVLSACGVCQERLAFWGLDVEIAVPKDGDGLLWQSRTLRELRPFYWDDVKRGENV